MLKLRSGLLLLLMLFAYSCGSNGDPNPSNGGSSNLNNGAVGESANDLLATSNYTKLEVEIVYAQGFEPPTSSVNYLKSFLNGRLNKSGGINVTTRAIAAPGKAQYTLDQLVDIEAQNRTLYTDGSTIAAYFFFADGSYAENENVLGIAYRNTSMVLFQSRIEELSGGVGQASTSLLTSSVMAHEFGHILGLVNAGSPLQSDHQDEAHGRHCDIDNCLMYYAVESTAGLNDLLGLTSPPELDDQCLADLKSNGGK